MNINQQQYRSDKVKSSENIHILSKPLLANITLVHIEPFKAPRRKQNGCAMCDVTYGIQVEKHTVCGRLGRALAWA
jgi:hypothetical protein